MWWKWMKEERWGSNNCGECDEWMKEERVDSSCGECGEWKREEGWDTSCNCGECGELNEGGKIGIVLIIGVNVVNWMKEERWE